MYLSAVAGMYTDKSWYTLDLEIKAMRLLTVTDCDESCKHILTRQDGC